MRPLAPTAALAVLLAVLLAAPPTTAPAAQPPTPPKATAPGSDAAGAAPVIERALAAYRAMTSYSDTLRASYDLRTENEEDSFEAGEIVVNFRFSRPASFLIESGACFGAGGGSVRSDGHQLWAHSPDTSEYTVEPAPRSPDYDDISKRLPALQTSTHPIARLLLGDAESPELRYLSPLIASVGDVRPEARAGEPGRLISAVANLSDMTGSDDPCPATLWFSDRTGLLGELSIDMTEMLNRLRESMAADEEDEDPAHAQPKLTKAVMTFTLTDIRANPDLPGDTFVFTPGPDDTKVDELTMPWQRDRFDQDLLIGHPAPDFEGTTLDGKPFKLSDLRGRVVLMDFWATWCGPCVQAIPHIQKIHEQFKDKPVAVIGMNRDDQGAHDRVRSFLDKKKITFSQFLDADGAAAEKYGVTGIPCTVLIDKEGTVQKVDVGFMPGHEKTLADAIGRLLAGEDLFNPGDVRDPAEVEDARHAQDAAHPAAESRAAALEDISPAAITPAGGIGSGWANAYTARRFDTDGDGRDELVFPDMQSGDISILSADGTDLTRIKLRGGARNSSITSMEPVRRNGEIFWLVARSTFSMSGLSASELALHGPDGAALWTFRPDLPEKAAAQFSFASADFAGDPTPEFAVAINAYNLRKQGGNSYVHDPIGGYLAILDWSGAILAQKHIGRSVEYIHAVAPTEHGAPPSIIVFTESRIRRFTFDPAAAHSAPTPGNGQEAPHPAVPASPK